MMVLVNRVTKGRCSFLQKTSSPILLLGKSFCSPHFLHCFITAHQWDCVRDFCLFVYFFLHRIVEYWICLDFGDGQIPTRRVVFRSVCWAFPASRGPLPGRKIMAADADPANTFWPAALLW